jgi:hypothetical protein
MEGQMSAKYLLMPAVPELEMPESLSLTGDTHRFGGGSQVAKTHLFDYDAFTSWVRTYTEQKTVSAVCGLSFRPDFMGVHAMADEMCLDCQERMERKS